MMNGITEQHYLNMEKIEAVRGEVEILKAAYEAELISKEMYDEQLKYLLGKLREFT